MTLPLIVAEMERLSVTERLYLMEQTIKSIQQEDLNRKMEKAAQDLHDDYENDKELTLFTDLNTDPYYEAG